MTYIYPVISNCYQYCVPSFIADQVEKIQNELIFCLEKMYVGGSSYRCDQQCDAYLKSKAVYIAPNPWDLAKSLAIYSIFAAIGYLIASTGMVWVGYGVMVGCAYFAIGETKENFGGNHLEKALNTIKPLETLTPIPWSLSPQTNKISVDLSKVTENVMRGLDDAGMTKIVVYKLPAPVGTPHKALYKIYYLGTELFLRSKETIYGNRIDCNNLLAGEDIKYLLDVADSKK